VLSKKALAAQALRSNHAWTKGSASATVDALEALARCAPGIASEPDPRVWQVPKIDPAPRARIFARYLAANWTGESPGTGPCCCRHSTGISWKSSCARPSCVYEPPATNRDPMAGDNQKPGLPTNLTRVLNIFGVKPIVAAVRAW